MIMLKTKPTPIMMHEINSMVEVEGSDDEVGNTLTDIVYIL